MHHIQKHILRALTYTKNAKFSAMRPPKVDSNAYSYHLKVLLKEGYLNKTADGYMLSPHGLGYVDRVSLEKFEPRLQPKIITQLLTTDKDDRVLLFSKRKQPFIGSWGLPYGKMHLDDSSIEAAAIREAKEKMNLPPVDLQHVGCCFIEAKINGEVVSYVQAHVFRLQLSQSQVLHPDTQWFSTEQRKALTLLPATEVIIDKAKNASTFFFAHYSVDRPE